MEEVKERNSFDLKAVTFASLSTIADKLNSNSLEGITINGTIEVSILTSFATIIGTILNESDDDSKVTEEFLIDKTIGNAFEIRDNILKKLKNKNPNLKILNNSGSIKLKDVTIIPFANPESKTNFKYLILFADEIKGLTLLSL